MFFVFATFVNAQNYVFPKNADEEYEFSEVINNNLSKSALFVNAKTWVMDVFKNYKAVVQIESESNGRIVAKGNYEDFIPKLTYNNFKSFTYERVYFTITIDCKENKYRYRINDIVIKSVRYSSYIDSEDESEIKHEDHIRKKERAVMWKVHLKKEMSDAQQTLKGRKLTKKMDELKEQLDRAELEIEYENDIYIAEFNFFELLCNSIKKKMAINDDF